MRLENYNVASFEDVGVADEPMAATAAPAVEPAPEPEAPSTQHPAERDGATAASGHADATAGARPA